MLVCDRGSITFGAAGEPVVLAAGDRLDLPADTSHDAVVGPDGVTCLEAHLPAGQLAALRHRLAGSGEAGNPSFTGTTSGIQTHAVRHRRGRWVVPNCARIGGSGRLDAAAADLAPLPRVSDSGLAARVFCEFRRAADRGLDVPVG